MVKTLSFGSWVCGFECRRLMSNFFAKIFSFFILLSLSLSFLSIFLSLCTRSLLSPIRVITGPAGEICARVLGAKQKMKGLRGKRGEERAYRFTMIVSVCTTRRNEKLALKGGATTPSGQALVRAGARLLSRNWRLCSSLL